MIYVLKSAGYDEFENRIDLVKIGFTKDEAGFENSTRRVTYKTQNPTIRIIHTIPNATEVHEKKIHFKFRNFLKYGNEWFSYEDEIIDYLRSVTLKELDELPDLELNDVTAKKYREAIRLSYDRLVVSNRIIIKEELEKFTELKEKMLLKLTYSRVRDYNLSDIFEKFNLEQEEINLIKKIINRDYSDLPTNIEEFLLVLINEGNFIKKMKLLCDSDFKGEELDYILKQLPSEFSKYYYTLGPEKIKARAYNRSFLKSDYNKLMFKGENELQKLIYSEFEEEKRYSFVHIKTKLTEFYKEVGNTNVPKATHLLDYFEVKNCKVTLEGIDKKVDGYKLIKKLK